MSTRAALLSLVFFPFRTILPAAESPACEPVVSRVKFTCLAGWQIVDENHPPGVITLGNYQRSKDPDQALIIPAGRSTIQIQPKPGIYRSTGEWIDAIEHGE